MGIRIYIQFCFKFFLADTADLNIISFFNTGCIFVFFRCQLMSGCRNHICKSLSRVIRGKGFLSVYGAGRFGDYSVVLGHVNWVWSKLIHTVIKEILCFCGSPCIIACIICYFCNFRRICTKYLTRSHIIS